MGRSLSEVQDITKNVLHSEYKYRLIHFAGDASRDIEKGTSAWSLPIPYKKWRVVALGFVVTTQGVSTENPQVKFGVEAGDLGNADNDYFGIVTQDINANKQFKSSDVWIKDPHALLATPLALTGGGTPTWAAGAGKFDKWLTATSPLMVTRPDDHALGVMVFMLLEVQIR